MKHLDFEAVFSASPANDLIPDRGIDCIASLGHAILSAGFDSLMHGGKASFIPRESGRNAKSQRYRDETGKADHKSSPK